MHDGSPDAKRQLVTALEAAGGVAITANDDDDDQNTGAGAVAALVEVVTIESAVIQCAAFAQFGGVVVLMATTL